MRPGAARRRPRRKVLASLAAWAAAVALPLPLPLHAAPAAAPPAAGRVLRLEPGQSLAERLREARDGDVIEIAGEHRGQVGTILQRRLTLRGVGATPSVLHAEGRHAEGKAILVVRDGEVRIENLEFRGARVPDRNGAGIRFERGRLVVARCRFADNENGILTANFRDAELELVDCEFAGAPPGTPLPHLVYVGRIGRFTMSGCRVAGGRQGHLVKSRAFMNHVRHNALLDDADGQAAYELEFPNGGIAFVVGNVIGQSALSSNPVLLSYGAEGGAEPDRAHALLLAHNTFVARGLRPAIFVHAGERIAEVERLTMNNLCLGLGAGELSLVDPSLGNFSGPLALLDDVDSGRYRLGAHSLLRGRAVGIERLRALQMLPTAEFSAPRGTQPLAEPARWSPGAFQS